MADSYFQSNSVVGKVECHAPKVVKRHIDASQTSRITKTAPDLTTPPVKININKSKCGTSSKGKYVKSRYLTQSTKPKLTLSFSNTSKDKEAKTSTPACKSAGMPHLDVSDINASYISSKSRQISRSLSASAVNKNASKIKAASISVPKIKTPLWSTRTESTKQVARKKSDKDCSSSDAASKTLLYNEYLQWKFLNAKLKNFQKHRNSKSLAAVGTLLEAEGENIDKQEHIETEIMRLKHLQKLRDQLEEQNDNIKDVTDRLPSLQENFTQFTENLEMTCHRLPLEGIYPIDEDKMTSTLKETRHLLGEANILIQAKTAIIKDMEIATGELSTTVEECKVIVDKVDSTMGETLNDTLKLQSLSIQDTVTA